MNPKSKALLVLERSSSDLKIEQDGGEFVLSGIFTEFGVRNKNQRLYEEKDVLPHIDELNKKIEKRRLLGELDHPKSYDVSLKNASHVIEELRYDKDSRKVFGKIRLLNTSAGKEAKALVEAGIPLHISSRAAGIVESDGRVKLKKFFTYDLVADPGFENAQLERVNEAYGFADDDSIQLFEVSEEEAKKHFDFDFNVKEQKTEDTPMADTKNFLSEELFNQFSETLKASLEAKFKTLNEQIENLQKQETTNDVEELKAEVESLKDEGSRVKELEEVVEGLIKHNDYIVENMSKISDYAEFIAEAINEGSESNESGKLIEYVKMLAEKVDQHIQFTDHLSEEISNRFDYQEHINEHVDGLISHSDYLVENIDSVVRYSEYIKENVEDNAGSLSQVFESIETINESLKNGGGLLEKKEINENVDEKVEQVNESMEVNQEVDSILTESTAEEQKAEENRAKHKFYPFLTKEQRAKFDSMEGDELNEMVEAFSKARYFGSRQVNQIWESVVNKAETLDWLKDMPNKYRPIWESLSEEKKNVIKAQASIRPLVTEYAIQDFWASRDLRNVKVEINEGEKFEPINESSKYTVSDDRKEFLKEQLKKRFNQ